MEKAGAQLTCSDYDLIKFRSSGNASNSTCTTDKHTWFFFDQTQNAGPTFQAHQLIVQIKITGNAEFQEELTAASLIANTPSSVNFEYGFSFPDKKTMLIAAYCSGNPWAVPFGSGDAPFLETFTVPAPGAVYDINTLVKAWVSPQTSCSQECVIGSSNAPNQVNSTPSCPSSLALSLGIDGHVPVNGKYTLSPHEEVTARLTLKNNGTSSVSLADFDLSLMIEDLHGTLPLPGQGSADWEAWFLEATEPPGTPFYESHYLPAHYFHFGPVGPGTLPPGGSIDLLVFSVPPPGLLNNLLGGLTADAAFARLLDGNGQCCALDVSGAAFEIEFPGILPCDPTKEIKFSLLPASGFDDCETGFELQVELTGPSGPITSMELSELLLILTTVSTDNLEIKGITGGNPGIVSSYTCTQTSCPSGSCQNCTITFSYSGSTPLTLSNGDTWRFVFRGSDATQIKEATFVSAAVKINGSSGSCIPVTNSTQLAPDLPIMNECKYCLDYAVQIGPYNGTQNLNDCEAGFSVYLHANDQATPPSQIRVEVDFQNFGNLSISAVATNICSTNNNCPPVQGNCVSVNGNKIIYGLCVGNINVSNSPVRLYDVVVTGDGCLTDLMFNMNTLIKPEGAGDACMPADISTFHEICTANCPVSEFLFSGSIMLETGYPVRVPIFPQGSGPSDSPESGIFIFNESESMDCRDKASPNLDGECDVLTATIPFCTGNYEASLPCASNPTGSFNVRPFKDTNPLNGVTTFDLVLIHRHIIGTQLLDSPYKIIAADANRSNTVTTVDILSLRRLILLIDDRLENNTSWRFISADHVFPNPANPWQTFWDECRTVSFSGSANSATGLDFIAIKVGDVNNSVEPCSNFTDDSPLDRSAPVPLTAAAPAAPKRGETVSIDIWLQDPAELVSWELGLRFDPHVLRFLEALPGDLEGMTGADFGTTRAGEGELRALWVAPMAQPVPFKDGHHAFTLRFEALQAVSDLASVLSLDDSVLSGRAYRPDGTARPFGLDFGPVRERPAPVEIPMTVTAQPNPFSGELRLLIALPEDDWLEVSVTDLQGRRVAAWSGESLDRRAEVTFSRTADWGTGNFTYRVGTVRQTVTGIITRQ